MGGNRLFALFGIVVVLGVAAYFLIPGFQEKVDATIGKKHWTAEERRKDPGGFIEYSIGKLGDNITRFEEARANLGVQKRNLERVRDMTGATLAFAGKQLEAFKASFKDAAGGKGWPVSVAGANYTEPQLKSQVKLFLGQKAAYEKTLVQLGQGSNLVEKRELEIVNRITESQAKRSQLEAQKVLVEANQLTKETEKLLDDVDAVIAANDSAFERPVVRTVEEMMKDAGQTPGGAPDADVDAFLKG